MLTETLVAFFYVIFGELLMWIVGLTLAGYLAFYIITLIVDQLSPAELTPERETVVKPKA